MSYGAVIKSRPSLRRLFSLPSSSPSPFVLLSRLVVGIDDIAPILRDDSFFLRVMASAGPSRIYALCARGEEIRRTDTIELSYCKSLFLRRRTRHVHGIHGSRQMMKEKERERETAVVASVRRVSAILISG